MRLTRSFRFWVVAGALAGSAPAIAQAPTPTPPTKPSPQTLLRDWADNHRSLETQLRSYRLEGEYQEQTPEEASALYGGAHVTKENRTGPVLRWRAVRQGTSFLWAKTNGAWEWNPRADPRVEHDTVSFDGSEYRRLIKRATLPHYRRRRDGTITLEEPDPPHGTIVSVSYQQEHPARFIVARTNEEMQHGDPEVVTDEYDRSLPHEAFRNWLPYPFEPAQLVLDPFNTPSSGSGVGDLLSEYRKRLRHLSVSGPERVEGQDCWRLELPPRFAQSPLWLPSKIWFDIRDGRFVPVRFFGTTESLPRGKPEVERVVSVRRHAAFRGAWWPEQIEADLYFFRSGKRIHTLAERKTARVSNINRAVPRSDLQVQMPKYARVERNGVSLPREPIPEPPRLWWRGALAGAAIVAGGVTTGIVLRRRRSARLSTP